MRTKLIMLICIFAVAIASIFATVKDKIHVSVCVGGTVRCLPIEDAKKLVKQGLGVYGDCSTANTGKIIRCN